MTVKNTFFNDGDDNWNSTPNLYVYEKQPLIGVVHELIVEIRDDILTIYPFFINEAPTIDNLTHAQMDFFSGGGCCVGGEVESWTGRLC